MISNMRNTHRIIIMVIYSLVYNGYFCHWSKWLQLATAPYVLRNAINTIFGSHQITIINNTYRLASIRECVGIYRLKKMRTRTENELHVYQSYVALFVACLSVDSAKYRAKIISWVCLCNWNNMIKWLARSRLTVMPVIQSVRVAA